MIKRASAFPLFLLSALLFFACNEKNSNAELRSGPVTPGSVYPRYLEIPVPSGGIGVQTNPPILRWPRDKGKHGLYEVRLSQDSLFPDGPATITAQTAMALYNPHRKLAHGTWFWQYRKTGKAFSKTLAFEVNDKAVPVVSPSSAEFLKTVPAGHPRILFGEEDRRLLQALKDEPDAQAIIAEALAALDSRIPAEKDAYSKEKGDTPGQQRKFDLDASQDASSAVYEKILSLAQAFVLTGESRFADKAVLFGMEVSSWDPEGITRLSDFGDARCMLGMALVLDTFYDRLDQTQKGKLIQAITARAANFYRSWINDTESKVLSGHVWQHILHYFFQTALVLHGEEPQAADWLTYAYELFLGRAPALGALDGGWVEGVSYFRMNMETMLDIPLFIKKFTGFDFINSHPWYRGNTQWMVYHIPPGSSADGFGDNTEEVHTPGAAYIAYAEETAKLTGDPLAAWYTRECRKYENPNLSKEALLRWVRLTKTRALPFQAADSIPELPMGAVFPDIGLAAIHSNLLHTPNDLMVTFKSSPFGSYGHMLCDQNTFNILYGGEKLFFRTGYKVTMDDPHRTGWYRTTKSQNGILIDGKGQAYSNDAYGWIARFMQGDEIAYVKGDATQAYKNETTGEPEAKKVIRHLLLLKPDLIVLYDELESDREVHWDWMIHSFRKMETDPAAGIFSVSAPAVKGAGKIFSSRETQWTLTDTFDVPAVNWRKSRYEDGRLKTYDDPQWHLRVTTRQKSRTAYYLTVIRVSPDTNPGRFRDIFSGNLPENDTTPPNGLNPEKDGNIGFTIGQWTVSASLDPDDRPDLVIRKLNGEAAFSMYAGEIVLDGEKIRAKQPGSSLLVEKKNGHTTIRESGDVYPQMMKNTMLLR